MELYLHLIYALAPLRQSKALHHPVYIHTTRYHVACMHHCLHPSDSIDWVRKLELEQEPQHGPAITSSAIIAIMGLG